MKAKKAKAKTEMQLAAREPSLAEREAIEAAKANHATLAVRPEIAVTKTDAPGVLQFGAQHSDEQGPAYQLAQALASRSNDFVGHQLLGIANAVGSDEQQINSALALIAAVGARDEPEAALAVQIAVTHDTALAMLTNARKAKTIPALSTYGNLATKFQRTLTSQIEALAKLRNGGVQTVRHVHVNEGGQAIIADQFNSYGGVENAISVNQSDAARAAGSGPALPSPDPFGNGVPIPGGQRQTAMQDARRHESGRA